MKEIFVIKILSLMGIDGPYYYSIEKYFKKD